MSVAIFNHEAIAEVGPEMIEELKRRAGDAPLRRFRLCLHHGPEDTVHEMIIAFRRDSLVPPHRHLDKCESFHMIEGEVEIRFFDDSGDVVRRVRLGAPGSGLPFIYRLSAPLWHEVVPLSEHVVLHEITSGPFKGSDLGERPPWETEERHAS
jgi:glucose-6-phosphate isomerase